MGYPQKVAPFRYSSGEAVTVSSDAQNVDFGVAFNPKKHVAQFSRPEHNGAPRNVVRATPENRTSDYGAVWYPFPPPKGKREKPVSVAIKSKRGGVGSTNGFTVGVRSGGMVAGTATHPLDAVSRPFEQPSIDYQNEAAAYNEYAGQL